MTSIKIPTFSWIKIRDDNLPRIFAPAISPMYKKRDPRLTPVVNPHKIRARYNSSGLVAKMNKNIERNIGITDIKRVGFRPNRSIKIVDVIIPMVPPISSNDTIHDPWWGVIGIGDSSDNSFFNAGVLHPITIPEFNANMLTKKKKIYEFYCTIRDGFCKL